jgi:Regulator of ribonuclease activity B
MNTEDELALLREDGVAADTLIWTAHFFSHPHSAWEARQAFRDALRAAGFTGIGSDEELAGDGYWHHWSHTIRTADMNALRDADRTAEAIARAHGVRYDEWMVLRNLSTGELRPAAPDDIARLKTQDERSFSVARRPA